MVYETSIPIGSGAVGEVFKAWDPELERYVACKYLRYDDPGLLERLMREARAQARVDHPAVCKVYEVGERDGRSFIAMEYVEGSQLGEAAGAMSLEQKVLVMREVADAVHAAHLAGLIHRDLKPGNIMISESESGAIRPYVLDFGIARESRLPGLTVTGQFVGTPGYLSPEQALGETTTLDRRTDVFSLGVILYQLFCGKLPFSGESEIEVIRALIEDEPLPLRKLAPSIPRDLDTVVMCCLEKNPEQRYPSARALSEELTRFLEGEPVAARPISTARRMLRRARKHKVATAALGIAATTVLVAAAALITQWIMYTVDLRDERNTALEARRIAEQKENETAGVSSFLVDTFKLSNPRSGRGQTVTARELLDTGFEELRSGLGEQPLTRATMLMTIGSVYANLGIYDRSFECYDNAYNIRRDELGENHLDVADSLFSLGSNLAAQRLFVQGEERLRQALGIRINVVGEDHELVAETKRALANCLRNRGNLEEAETMVGEAAAVLTATRGATDHSVLLVLEEQAGTLRMMNRLDEAEDLYREILEVRREASEEHQEYLPKALNSLALVLRQQGELDESEALYREALILQTETWGPEHPNTLVVLRNLAGTLTEQEEFDEAEELLRRVVEIRRKISPEGHWRVGSALVSSLGRFLSTRGKYDEAELMLREGVAIWEASLGGDHSWTATGRGQLAAVLYGVGKESEADRLLALSLAGLSALDHLSPDNRAGIDHTITILEQVGRFEEAARFQLLLQSDSD